MNNIKQNYKKFIISFFFLLSFSSCQTMELGNKTIIETEKVEVAILMPLSGERKDQGNENVRLITQGIKDGLDGQINLTIYDGATEKLAADNLNKIIEKNTKIILGPLTSNVAAYIGPRVKEHGIIMITLSNNPVLTDDKVFVFGHAPSKQLLPLTNYFLQNNYSHFITLLPSTPHYAGASQIIQNLIVREHGMLDRAVFYSPTPDSIEQAISLVSASIDNLRENEGLKKLPVVIVGGEDNTILTMLFNSIHNQNLDCKAIIAGDNKLDFYYSGDINLIFTGSLNLLNSGLVRKGVEENILHINFMHALAYDLGKMTATFIGTEFNEKIFLSRINAKLGYIGTSGKINFIDGIATREYDIIQRTNNNYKTLWSINQRSLNSE